MYSSRQDGGVGMPNIVIQDRQVSEDSMDHTAMHNPSGSSQLSGFVHHVAQPFCEETSVVKNILTSNLCSTNRFWEDVLLEWAELSYNDNPIDVEADAQQLWGIPGMQRCNERLLLLIRGTQLVSNVSVTSYT